LESRQQRILEEISSLPVDKILARASAAGLKVRGKLMIDGEAEEKSFLARMPYSNLDSHHLMLPIVSPCLAAALVMNME
jgi:hypothetical protein